MSEKHITIISRELSIKPYQVTSVITLFDEGGTVPFIARYRKEATGSLDEVQITAIRDRLEQLREIDKRREAILKSLEDQEVLSDELKEKVEAATTLTELEDIYLPYRPKRRTRATIAREKGLEPLAELIFEQGNVDVKEEAEAFIDAEKEVGSIEDALAGARDIMAEWINENQEARQKIRDLFFKEGRISSRLIIGRDEEGAKFRDYFDWSEPLAKAPSHRVLAMRRGEKELFLVLSFRPDEEKAINILEKLFIKANNAASEEVKPAVADSYKRLLANSMETEVRLATKERADEGAIHVFRDNLRELLLASPLGQKNVLAIDPGFRTGCKVVCLNSQGKLLVSDTIYPHNSEKNKSEAGQKILALCEKYTIDAIAIGNGTAGRETEAFVRSLTLPHSVQIVMVNESGASIYSASEVAREEFPHLDLTVRGTVSIGRRLIDPLAELVKIDPKSIGVGQYQHDVDQSALKKSLDDVVISSVNAVGVEINSASKQLLTYVAGLGPQLAGNIIDYRNEAGPFKSRKDFMKVPRLGAKAFEQAAGFLRLRGENPLDASAVHPESYNIVETMAKDLGCLVKDLMSDEELRKKIDLEKYITETVGRPTLEDIMAELAKPGRDPRKSFEAFAFAEDIDKPEDLQEGMKLPGIVTNVTAFGAFVDIGVHQDGLVHISELSDNFVKNPADVVKVQQKVIVSVLEVDLKRNRISLSMKSTPGKSPAPKTKKKESPGKVKDGKKQTRHTKKPKAPKPAFSNNPFAAAFKK
ncbi:MAG: RNA-binding transcriptional accessory protein [Deltaproteobacteria bacterium]|nr:RNA-binding transcriptional accessory protein [Deltaproteobacteria bacterium]